ncbi:Ig-like domain-containing protein [Flavobacterium sp. GT3R68]|uniref:Ig-like domain-containing protein n=1 Tax=Flavobacterium sp. GT3R68 TaxID=2594437 RepID=UPI000F8995F5|nr:Ig-like domain-containing protein [Flavobacterium sp. GT3R68]RTY96050.1 hypothetical protein EKL32_03690 [Flavobacterium sp. GSN2]TRW94168.1 hypothetical protein FNW07_01080 [Flavobacterium sp. GT3R68]
MLKNNFKYIFLLALLTIIGCAKRGSITGGSKDTIAPVLRMSVPKNYSTNFKGNTIKLTFDEFIKLKDLTKQIIISPPMAIAPTITPTTASKTITIHFNDTLQANTTYNINFGQSIEDNNESNPYKQFKYVFSTGSYVDSLTLGGRVKDALNKEADPNVSVMLYEVNGKFTDSIIYKEAPRYITKTPDSMQTFLFENLKAGKYLLVAMKDLNSNNKFNPRDDKIGFHKQYVTVPNDTVYEVELFKETPKFKTLKPVQASGNRLLLPYEGKPKDLKIVLKNGNDILPTIVTQFPKKDSVQIWYKPIKTDSLNLAVTKEQYSANFNFKIKDQKKDSLSFEAKQGGVLSLRDKFTLIPSRPLVKFDNSKMKITKDSTNVVFKTEYNEFLQQLEFDFVKEPLKKYTIKILPGALTDYLEQSNDTLSYTLTTKNTSDYGNLKVNLQNVRQFPVIVQLISAKGEIIASEYSEVSTVIDFTNLDPALFTLRLIYDENKNKEWDSGNYLEKTQAEEVIYFPKEIDVRANWDVDQIFDVSSN